MTSINLKFIFLIFSALLLMFTIGFFSGSMLSYKNCLIKYEYERLVRGDVPVNLAVLINSLEHVFEYPAAYPGYNAPTYPLEIVDHAFFTDNYFYLALRNNKERKIKILANSVNVEIRGHGKCENGPLEDIELTSKEEIVIHLKCNSMYGNFKMGENYMSHLDTTIIDLSSGEKIYGDASLWGTIEEAKS